MIRIQYRAGMDMGGVTVESRDGATQLLVPVDDPRSGYRILYKVVRSVYEDNMGIMLGRPTVVTDEYSFAYDMFSKCRCVCYVRDDAFPDIDASLPRQEPAFTIYEDKGSPSGLTMTIDGHGSTHVWMSEQQLPDFVP